MKGFLFQTFIALIDCVNYRRPSVPLGLRGSATISILVTSHSVWLNLLKCE
jgi:hypothetical protein